MGLAGVLIGDICRARRGGSGQRAPPPIGLVVCWWSRGASPRCPGDHEGKGERHRDVVKSGHVDQAASELDGG
jgi:hypothetical protein